MPFTFEKYRRHRDSANAFMERMMNGASNHEILAKVLGDRNERFLDHVYELPKDQMTESSLSNAAKYKLQLHAFFDKPDPNADYSDHSNVYLVGRPNRWARGLSRTPKPCHWSIYTRGHAYHLKLVEGDQELSLGLRDNSSLDWKYQREPIFDPFIAYHIGVTDYEEQHVSLLAKWVVEQLDHHELSTAAYEQFVFGLGIRILRGPSNTTALIGDFTQIQNHDKESTTPSGFLTGVRLADPHEDISTWAKRYYLIYRIETDARGLDLCWKKGILGKIPWNTHEYHSFIRPLAVGPPAVTKIFTKVGQRIPILSKAVPPLYHRGMAMAAIYRLREESPLPRDLVFVPFYGTLHYIRATHEMAEDEFWFLVNDFLNSPFVECVTFNRGFGNRAPLRGDPDRSELTGLGPGSSPGGILQSSSSTMVEKESDELELTVDGDPTAGQMLPSIQLGSGPIRGKEDGLFDTLVTHWFEHKGVLCQVFIDGSAFFEPPVEI
ncbi:uncharacterized protein N7500_010039 [Penicillium coprophilum]|uniref:uncharacterized protein n=1 Tax=Penicillium coprophilum TaxID=36646 RepID=UPI00239C79C6|nr:uncharacterized protein N7500_010039 [Penicillium coprophilum]KAJ5154600.1 hypothetical protein N7500_010039 [Penicillium coprophilum]